MQSELTLNTRCPACGTLKPKTLAAIKVQSVFECECGFHAPILNGAEQVSAQFFRKRKATVTT